MARTIRSKTGIVFGDVVAEDIVAQGLVTNGLFSPQGGSENIVGNTIITSTTNLSDVDGSYYVIAGSSFTITLPATTTNGRTIEIIDGTGFSSQNVTIGRNGNTIGGVAENLTVNVSANFKLVYYDGDWKVKT